jgi:SAM-dependent methyltransferase
VRRRDVNRETWDALAREDAQGAVLVWASDLTEAAFFATGETAIAGLFESLRAVGAERAFASALDFGCGLGRLTRALAAHVPHVVGVDISPVMLQRAAVGAPANCEWVQTSERLPALGSRRFDLVVSLLVLQHLRPRRARHGLQALAERVAPRGVLVVQLPIAHLRDHAPARSQVRRLARRAVPDRVLAAFRRTRASLTARGRRRHGEAVMELHWMPRRRVERVLIRAGLDVINVSSDVASVPEFESLLVIAERRA